MYDPDILIERFNEILNVVAHGYFDIDAEQVYEIFPLGGN